MKFGEVEFAGFIPLGQVRTVLHTCMTRLAQILQDSTASTSSTLGEHCQLCQHSAGWQV